MWIPVKERSVCVCHPLRAKYLPSSTRALSKAGMLCPAPQTEALPSSPGPQTGRRLRTGWILSGKDNVEAKQVFCPCFLAKSCQSLWKQSFVLESCFLKENFLLPYCKEDHSWWTRLSDGFFCFWGMRKIPSCQVYLCFNLISLQQMASQSKTHRSKQVS